MVKHILRIFQWNYIGTGAINIESTLVMAWGRQATWTNADPDLCRHMAYVDCNGLTLVVLNHHEKTFEYICISDIFRDTEIAWLYMEFFYNGKKGSVYPSQWHGC